MDPNGWNDIGYSFVVGEDSNVYEGRGWDAIGAHTRGYNDRSIGICVIGDFTGRLPNNLAISTIQQLIQCGVEIGKIDADYELLARLRTRNVLVNLTSSSSKHGLIGRQIPYRWQKFD